MGAHALHPFYRALWHGLDLLFPPACGGCGRPGQRWCPDCRRQVLPLAEPVCEVCGLPVERAGPCPDCRRARPSFRALRSWSAFESPLREALHRLKYRRDLGLGEALAEAMYDFTAHLPWPVEVVVPVPLGARRLRERGYNQASLIAYPLALALGLVYAPAALARVRETRSQIELSREERYENVRGAFQASPKKVKGRVVLLVDDVATTGSTLSSCAEALYAAGAQDVFALTVARALERSQAWHTHPST